MNLTEDRITKFRGLIENATGNISIVIAQVDPDALGAARGIAWLVNQLRPKNGLEVNTFYAGSISHPQNQAIVNRFDLLKRMKPMKSFSVCDNHNVILDSSSVTDGRLLAQTDQRIDPFIVIDHHRGSEIKERDETFVWIEDVGSASTILTELIQSLGFGFGDTNQTVALLLALGIHTDTGSLTDCFERDRLAYNVLTSAVSNQDLTQLFRYPLPQSHFVNVERALRNKVVQGGKLVTHIGKISSSDGDDLSSIADDLIRMSGVTLVVVWGIIDKMVRISARNADITNPLDIFLRERLPSSSCGAKLSSDGRGIGGGNLTLDLGVWMIEETTEEVVSLVSKWIQTKIFEV